MRDRLLAMLNLTKLRRAGPCAVAICVVMALVVSSCSPSRPAETADDAAVLPPPPPPRHLTLAAVGDIMLDRSVGAMINRQGCTYIIEQLAPRLREADITFGNLECPLSTVGPHSPREDLIFRAHPKTIKVLVLGGFDIVSLANNHTLNAGRAGLLQTLQHLEEANIAYVGAAADKAQGSQPAFVEVNRLTVGFLAYTDLDFAHGSYSKVDKQLADLRSQIAAAKNKCDLLAVSYHWGTEYHRRPSARQIAVAHTSIDAGADVVLGHHPHVLQGVEMYKQRPILYSIGNFIFDQRAGERMESGLFMLHYTEERGWRVAMKPIWIPRSRLGPEYATGERQVRILQRFKQLSEELDTTVIIEAGQALIPAPVSVSQPEASPVSNTTSNLILKQGEQLCTGLGLICELY